MKTSGPIFVVVNACSGSNGVQDKLDLLRTGFDAGSRPYELLVADDGAQVSNMARRAVEQAEQTQGVVAVAGGDGTINAVGQIALAREVPFGIIPEGTFNYLSRSESIPQDPAEAIRTIIHGDIRPVQAGLGGCRVMGRLGDAPEVTSFEFETLSARIGRRGKPARVKVAADGEITLMTTPLTFRPSPHRLQLIVSRPAAV